MYLAEHEGDIILHRTSKKAFNELGLTKLPSRKDLSAESTRLKAEKSTQYAEYRKAQDEMCQLCPRPAETLLYRNGRSLFSKESLL